LAWVIYFLIIIFIVTAVTNSVNLTDGIDGLAAGVSAVVGTGLGILAYMSGNTILAKYLNILYVPLSGEVVVFLAALVGACIGFIWYNSFPAQVFMGDTGSLALGGALAAVAIIIKMELLLPILCGIFFVESLSVIIQVGYFKYTKKKYGEGRRVFRMSPVHHHFELGGIPEPKIVTRFWIIAILLVIVTLALLKLR
jgi:phospho-N-acetylmuramoyl-pentapeptide-transferase